jgi:hypothetical protein
MHAASAVIGFCAARDKGARKYALSLAHRKPLAFKLLVKLLRRGRLTR